MEIQVKYLRVLLDQLIAKHEETTEKKAFERIGENIPGIGSDYLYKKIAQPISNMRPGQSLGLRESKVIALLQNLGYQSIKSFKANVDSPLTPQQQSLVGNYYSYLRKNAKEGSLLRSPVTIFENNKKIWMELTGKRLSYAGELKLESGYLYVLLESKSGKRFYHGYKIGGMVQPSVLQGIFSGTTSGFDPIGGRVVLVRTEEAKKSLSVAELRIVTLKKSKNRGELSLAKYFDKYTENNLSINKTTSFTLDDLNS